jgi:hypothetical protein
LTLYEDEYRFSAARLNAEEDIMERAEMASELARHHRTFAQIARITHGALTPLSTEHDAVLALKAIRNLVG